MSSELQKAIVRFFVGALLLLNIILIAAGKNPLPVDETTATEVITVIVSALGAAWSWYWKNNNIRKNAGIAQDYKRALDQDGDGSDSLEEEV